MISARFDPSLFFQRTENVALHVPAEELFGLMKRTLDMPSAWGALVSRTSGAREVVRAGDVVVGTDAADVMFVRCTPIELTLHEDRLITADSIICQAEVTLRVGVIPEQGDLGSFAQAVMGSRRVIQAKDLARFLQPVVQSTLASGISGQASESLLSPAFTEALSTALHEALQGPCFAAGLSVEGMPVVRVRSESLAALAETKEQIARSQAEHEAASDLRRAVEQAQKAHLEHVANILRRLGDMAKDSPHASLGALIQTFPEAQRGELYGALFAVEPVGSRTRWIVVAAGDELLYFDPAALDRPVRTVTVEGSAGRVRSVQSGAGDSSMFWLGAERGVYAWPIAASMPSETYQVTSSSSVRGGFNAVAVADDHVIASHSELGLWRWNRGEGGGRAILEPLTESAKTIRHVQVHEGFLYCAIDDQIVRWEAHTDGADASFFRGSTASITALLVTDSGIYAGTSDGDVLHWAHDRREHPERLHAGSQRAVESLFQLETHGVRRVFFTETAPRVSSRVIGDDFVRFYEAGGQTLRRVEVARDIVVGTNELRDRLFVWDTGAPGRARSVIPIGSITGRSVQDVCLTV